jgi:hypothetical protein
VVEAACLELKFPKKFWSQEFPRSSASSAAQVGRKGGVIQAQFASRSGPISGAGKAKTLLCLILLTGEAIHRSSPRAIQNIVYQQKFH